jgi:hypothetical protein
MKKRTKLLIGSFVSALLALYFFLWAIQTAWLGSFPAKNGDYYRFWAYAQIGVSVLFIVVSIVMFMRCRNKPDPSTDGQT